MFRLVGFIVLSKVSLKDAAKSLLLYNIPASVVYLVFAYAKGFLFLRKLTQL